MSRRIAKLAIANRGEVAVRIIRACQDMGVETVLLHSTADIETLAYRLADQCVSIGPAAVNESYLNIDRNIQGALSAGVDAIHPGFGFLSENADFAEACEKARLIFVGPSAESIRLFGDKISAKRLVTAAGVPVVPGYDGEDQSEKKLVTEMERIGFPVIVKAAGGGGGRGLRAIMEKSAALEAIQSARREAKSAFNSEKLFVEKYLNHAKHIEVQIFGDASGRAHHLFERECSVQRRHQKIIEESPAAKLSPELRRKILAAAVEIATMAKYRGAGTVEFLVQDGEYYFMEMNTRLQVEHPVTEQVLGVDLVKAQILTAQESSVLWANDVMQTRGHSIECRVYAEDSDKGGIPSTGQLLALHWPHGPGRRFECGFEAGDTITPYYDPMIAKVIVWDENRSRAVRKMIETLKECVIFGVKTNIPYLQQILAHTEFVDGTMTTQFISQHFAAGAKPRDIPDEVIQMVAQAMRPSPVDENHPSPWLVGQQSAAKSETTSSNSNTSHHRIRKMRTPSQFWVHLNGETWCIENAPATSATTIRGARAGSAKVSSDVVAAPMPGKITKVHFKTGDAVKAKQVVIVMEAMKMEYSLAASRDGKIADVKVKEGAQVELNQVLVQLEPTK